MLRNPNRRWRTYCDEEQQIDFCDGAGSDAGDHAFDVRAARTASQAHASGRNRQEDRALQDQRPIDGNPHRDSPTVRKRAARSAQEPARTIQRGSSRRRRRGGSGGSTGGRPRSCPVGRDPCFPAQVRRRRQRCVRARRRAHDHHVCGGHGSITHQHRSHRGRLADGTLR